MSLVTGINFALSSYEKFQPAVSEMRKGQISWGRVLAPNSRNKANMTKHKNFNFRAYHGLGNSSSCITPAVKWDTYDVENTAVNAGRCHPDRKNEGVNGVNRLATKGEKYYWLPAKRVKNYRLPTGKILTDYRHGLTLSILVSEKRAFCIFF